MLHLKYLNKLAKDQNVVINQKMQLNCYHRFLKLTKPLPFYYEIPNSMITNMLNLSEFLLFFYYKLSNELIL